MTHAPESAAPAEGTSPQTQAAPNAPARPSNGIAVFTAGTVYPQFFVLLFLNIAFLFGAILPWGGEKITGLYGYPGAVVGFVSVGAVIASLSSIYSRRLVIWPTLLNWIIADCFVVAKLLGVIRENGDVFGKVFSADFKEGLTELGTVIGPGFVFMLFGAVFMLVFLVVSVFSGAKAQNKKKEAQKEAQKQARAARKSGKS